MSRRLKQRLVHGLLVALAVWPLVHIALVELVDLNAWKLAGWGMYSTPQFAARASIYELREGDESWREVPSVTPEQRRQLERFLNRRLGLRKLARPDRLGHALLRDSPQRARVAIVVRQPVLRRGSGMVEEDRSRYEYTR